VQLVYLSSDLFREEHSRQSINLPSYIVQARYTLPAAAGIQKIQRSSVVERSAVNRLVVGSNPTAGAKF
jgi:hypothetical protein